MTARNARFCCKSEANRFITVRLAVVMRVLISFTMMSNLSRSRPLRHVAERCKSFQHITVHFFGTQDIDGVLETGFEDPCMRGFRGPIQPGQ